MHLRATPVAVRSIFGGDGFHGAELLEYAKVVEHELIRFLGGL